MNNKFSIKRVFDLLRLQYMNNKSLINIIFALSILVVLIPIMLMEFSNEDSSTASMVVMTMLGFVISYPMLSILYYIVVFKSSNSTKALHSSLLPVKTSEKFCSYFILWIIKYSVFIGIFLLNLLVISILNNGVLSMVWDNLIILIDSIKKGITEYSNIGEFYNVIFIISIIVVSIIYDFAFSVFAGSYFYKASHTVLFIILVPMIMGMLNSTIFSFYSVFLSELFLKKEFDSFGNFLNFAMWTYFISSFLLSIVLIYLTIKGIKTKENKK